MFCCWMVSFNESFSCFSIVSSVASGSEAVVEVASGSVVVAAINGSDSVKLLSISMVFSSNDMVLFIFLYTIYRKLYCLLF